MNIRSTRDDKEDSVVGQRDRIASDPAILGGKSVVRGMRISVGLILSLMAQGETREAIMEDHPGLQPEDIRACLAYAQAVRANDRPDEVALTHA